MIIRGKTIEYFNLFFRNFVLIPAHLEEPIWIKSDKNITTYLQHSNLNKTPVTYGDFVVKQATSNKITLVSKNPNNNIKEIILVDSDKNLDQSYAKIFKEDTSNYKLKRNTYKKIQ